jgi:hypothetical protein
MLVHFLNCFVSQCNATTHISLQCVRERVKRAFKAFGASFAVGRKQKAFCGPTDAKDLCGKYLLGQVICQIFRNCDFDTVRVFLLLYFSKEGWPKVWKWQLTICRVCELGKSSR